MLIFRRWMEHNRPAITDIKAKRKARGGRIDAPISLAKVIVSTNLDEEFARFAELVGGRNAETYFLRVLQYAATHAGERGVVAVQRSKLGPSVLTRPWDTVSATTGGTVYDALLTSRICIPWVKPDSGQTAAGPGSDSGQTRKQTSGNSDATGNETKSDSDDESDNSLESDETGYPAGQDAGQDAASPRWPQPAPAPAPAPAVSPPPPSGGGSASPPEGEQGAPTNGHAEPPLTLRKREYFGKVLNYVVKCGATTREQQKALERRREHGAAAFSDERIRELLAGEYKWVTPDRIARLMNEGRPRAMISRAAE